MQKNILFIVISSVIILAGGIFFVLQKSNLNPGRLSLPEEPSKEVLEEKPVEVKTLSESLSYSPQKLSNPPEIIKAVYVTGTAAGNINYLGYLENLFKNTEINAVVFNIKGSEGYVSYNSGAPDVKAYDLDGGQIKDIDALVNFFHIKNIYVVGRISVFEDSVYAKARPELAIYDISKTVSANKVLWRDNGGNSWLDPASKDVWDYNVALANDAFLHGFDEINFDYIRFPSDGDLQDAGFPVWDKKTAKAGVIKSFFEYLRQNLQGKISVDLFGQTTTDTGDMGIGQIIEDAFGYFDYVSPMLYPSHYANGFLGFANPAEHPYETVKYSMLYALLKQKQFLTQNQNISQEMVAKFRPWLQDFNMGAIYNADMVKLEIKATQEALGDEYRGFMLWNPNNVYTEGAIKKIIE